MSQSEPASSSPPAGLPAVNRTTLRGLLFAVLILCGRFLFPSQTLDAAALAQDLGRKLDAYPKYENWAFRSTSINREMSKNWTPRKTTILEKRVRVSGGAILEEILKATEDNGKKIKDITRERIKKAEERKRRNEKGQAGRPRRGTAEVARGGGVYRVGLEEIFPFKEEKRNLYNFSLLEELEIEGRPVLALKSSAKLKDEDRLEGVYYIDKETLTILKANLRPSIIPKIVKEFDLEIGFNVLPSGHFVLKDIRFKVNGGIFIKHIRMEVEEAYTDYEILN